MTKTDLVQFAASVGIDEIGVSRAESLLGLQNFPMSPQEKDICPFAESDPEKRRNPFLLLPGARSIITCLFPYYSSKIRPQNVSRYASVKDYHKIAKSKLQQLADYINAQTGNSCVCCCDTSPLSDRYLAYCAGLGFYGKNHMLINRRYGSYFFIGSVISTVELETDIPITETCMGCGKCMRACPGGALSAGGFQYQNCVSYLTQAKELTYEQTRLLQNQEKIYGCDVCQDVCPHNNDLPDTAMKDFLDHPIENLPESDVLMLSNREFQKKYGEYPFAWRGRKMLARNLQKKLLDKNRV